MRYPTHLEDQDVDTVVAGLYKLRGDMVDFNRSMERWHLRVNVPLLYADHTAKTWAHFVSFVDHRINRFGPNQTWKHVFLTYFDDIGKLRERITKRLRFCNEYELILTVGPALQQTEWAVTPDGVSILPSGRTLVESYVYDSYEFKALKAITKPNQVYAAVWVALNSYGLATADTASTIDNFHDMLDFCEIRFDKYVN
jgi:hypothetical protein